MFVSSCCKGKATNLERLSYDDQWLIGDERLCRRHWNYQDCDQCPAQGNEVIAGWFGAVVQNVVGMTHKLFDGARESADSAESVDVNVCYVMTYIGFL